MSPWNYPVLLTLEPLVDAIAAGNTAVVKPSAYAPASANVLKDLLEECFPPEYVAVVLGGREENQALLQEKFDKIFFTGSAAVGKQVMESKHQCFNASRIAVKRIAVQTNEYICTPVVSSFTNIRIYWSFAV